MIDSFDFRLLREIVSCVLILSGVGFMLLSTIGLLRFPDFYIRISAVTKGATLGLGLILLGIGTYFNQPDIMLKVLVIIVFTFLTAPVAAHVIGRTAVQSRIPFWKKTNLEEFKTYLHQECLEQADSTDKYAEELPKRPKTADGGE